MEGNKSEKNYYLQKLFVCISERSLKCMLLRNHSFAIIYSYLYVPICSDFYGLRKKKHQSSLWTGITPPPQFANISDMYIMSFSNACNGVGVPQNIFFYDIHTKICKMLRKKMSMFQNYCLFFCPKYIYENYNV